MQSQAPSSDVAMHAQAVEYQHAHQVSYSQALHAAHELV